MKLKRIGDILIKLQDAISEFGFRFGKTEINWNNHNCLLSQVAPDEKPGFVQLTVDVDVSFNKTKIKTEQIYMNATRYIVSSSLYIVIA